MEDKLQKLTDKLYEEGLAKGRSDADKIVAEAQAKAAEIVKTAEEKAAEIEAKAARKADETYRNTMTEISLAGRQAVSALKEKITDMVVAKAVTGSVHAAVVEPKFIEEMLLAVASGWNNNAAGKVSLEALLPEQWRNKFDAELKGVTARLLSEGIEVGFSDTVKSGFRIGEKNGGYYIGFSDADFDALLSEFLKEKVADILYGKQ